MQARDRRSASIAGRHSIDAGGGVTIGVRPEDLVPSTGDRSLLRGTVTVVENLGELITAYLDVGGDQAIVKLRWGHEYAVGAELALSPKGERFHLFDPAGFRIGQRRPSRPASIEGSAGTSERR